MRRPPQLLTNDQQQQKKKKTEKTGRQTTTQHTCTCALVTPRETRSGCGDPGTGGETGGPAKGTGAGDARIM